MKGRDSEANDRPAGFFRGTEFPRLLILSGMVIAGWLVVIYTASRPRSDPPAPAQAKDARPVVPDTSLDFQAIRDKAPLSFRENGAYALLLERARSKSAEKLAKEARSDLLFTHFWERPDRYRGVAARLEGTAIKVLTYEVNPKLVPGGRIFEIWFVTAESIRFPYVIVVEDPPPGMPIGDKLNERIVAEGYFLKLLGYAAGDAPRAAPLFVGKVQWLPRDERAVGGGQGILQSVNWVFALILALIVYVGIRAFLQYGKFVGRPSRPRTALDPNENEPEAVEDFLKSLEDPKPGDPDVA